MAKHSHIRLLDAFVQLAIECTALDTELMANWLQLSDRAAT